MHRRAEVGQKREIKNTRFFIFLRKHFQPQNESLYTVYNLENFRYHQVCTLVHASAHREKIIPLWLAPVVTHLL